MMVLYEDLAARTLAIEVRDRLLLQFKGDVEIGFNWWRFDYLADPEIGREAASCAVSADLILVSFHRLADVSAAVKAWFETWLSKRTALEGALAVIRVSAGVEEPVIHDDAYLRLAARRANLDYLPLTVPPAAPQDIDRLRKDAVFHPPSGWQESPNPQYDSSGWGLND
jgi:hypothetical protein